MKMSPWYPGTRNPARKGVYQRKYELSYDVSYWDGKHWHWGSKYIAVAVNTETLSGLQCREFRWRGLASDPAQEKKNGKR